MIKMLVHVRKTALTLHYRLSQTSVAGNLLKVPQTRWIPGIEVTGKNDWT